MPKPRKLELDLAALLDDMAEQIAADPRVSGAEPVVVGIHTGGVWVAEALASRLGKLGVEDFTTGQLGISFYRDDFSRIGLNPRVSPSKLDPSLDGRVVVLVDDILFTGRTIRAAMNELFDYGRPDAIVLAILVDRGGRELPIQADVVGTSLALAPDEHVKLTGPSPLELEVIKK